MPVLFRIEAADGPDAFTIRLSDGYAATGPVAPGAIIIDPDCDRDRDD